MADLIKKIKIKKQDGTFTDYIPIGAEASNVSTEDGLSVENKLKKKPYYFDIVVDMKAAKYLKNGDVAITLGYYKPNDGGAGKYKIREKTETDVSDNGFIHEISDSLVAELIIENNTVNIRSLGARSQDKDNNKYDIKPYIDVYLNKNKNIEGNIKLYLPSGVYYTSPINIVGTSGYYIYGDESFALDQDTGTIITSLNDNQTHVINIGNNLEYTKYLNLKNIIFSTYDYKYSLPLKQFYVDTEKKVTDQVLKIFYCCFSLFDNLFFKNIKGRAFYLSSSWESYFGLLNFRNVNALNSSIMCFGTADTTINPNANITALCFDKIMFEKTLGHLIQCERRTMFTNSLFKLINFEDYKMTDVEYVSNDFSEFDENNYEIQAILKIDSGGIFNNIINNIQLNNFACRYAVIDGKQYCYDTMIYVDDNADNSTILNAIIDNIQTTGIAKNSKFLRSRSNVRNYSNLTINNSTINYSSNVYYYFDVDNFPKINVGNINSIATNYASFVPSFKKLTGKLHSFFETTGYLGTITKDNDSISQFGLCQKLQGKNTSNLICVEGNQNLIFRAKIPKDREVTFTIYSQEHYGTLTVVGTGNFEIYSFSLSETYLMGQQISLQTNSEENTDILLDYYYFN